jgi:hypothetical protein
MTMPTPSPKLAATVARVRSTGNAVETCERPSAVTSARPPHKRDEESRRQQVERTGVGIGPPQQPVNGETP